MHTSLTNCVGFGHMNPLQDSQPLLAASSCGSCRCSSCVHAAHCNPWCRCGEEILTRSLVHTQRVSALSPRYSVSSGVKFLRTSQEGCSAWFGQGGDAMQTLLAGPKQILTVFLFLPVSYSLLFPVSYIFAMLFFKLIVFSKSTFAIQLVDGHFPG